MIRYRNEQANGRGEPVYRYDRGSLERRTAIRRRDRQDQRPCGSRLPDGDCRHGSCPASRRPAQAAGRRQADRRRRRPLLRRACKLHRRGLRRVPDPWRACRGGEAAGDPAAAARIARRRARRVHAPRLRQWQDRPDGRGSAGRSHRSGDGGAKAVCSRKPGSAPCRALRGLAVAAIADAGACGSGSGLFGRGRCGVGRRAADRHACRQPGRGDHGAS